MAAPHSGRRDSVAAVTRNRLDTTAHNCVALLRDRPHANVPDAPADGWDLGTPSAAPVRTIVGAQEAVQVIRKKLSDKDDKGVVILKTYEAINDLADTCSSSLSRIQSKTRRRKQ